MALETTTYIDGLVATNPTSSDNVGDGDNHIRLTKSAIKQTFPAIAGAITATHTEINTGVELANTATNLNTANAVVKRDGNGNFVASQITATNITTSNITITGTVTGSLSGNASTASTANLAATANKWTTARSVTLGGDLTGHFTIDGSSDVGLSAYVVNDSHRHTISTIDGLSAELTRIEGTVSGAAVTSAGKWTTPRTLSLAGDITGAVTIDGSANATLNATVSDNSHSHTIANVAGLQGALNAKLESTSNAATATTLQTARSISLAGDVTGSASFDGGSNVSINAQVVNDSHLHTLSTIAGLDTALAAKLDSTAYTASDVLSKIKTVDGAGSGLDADLLDGLSSASYLQTTSASLTANGYVALNNGLQLQWGSVSIAGNAVNAAVTFPTGFGNGCLQVVISMKDTGVSTKDNYSLGTSAFSTTGFTITNGVGDARTFTYFAIGY
tara:strand:+ start:937 stop:2277 length:1341 start_codon:yes stop_codon:yes gene_type:complete